MNQSFTITSLDELNGFACKLIHDIEDFPNDDAEKQACVITLSGDLGAGKTTLTQMIGHHLEITEPMGSPTFVITKYYDLKNQNWKRLIHIDAYRLDGQNLEPLDFSNIFADQNNIVIIEWPEYIASVLPKNIIDITITHNSNDSRKIDIK